jgi:hypothetical protein
MRVLELGLLGLLGLGCGSTPELSPWEKEPRDLPCGFDPISCLGTESDMLEVGELIPSSSAVDRRPHPHEYAGRDGCELGYVLDVPSAKLTGDGMQLKALWNQYDTTRGLDGCVDYQATHRVYTPDSSMAGGYRLVDHRTFAARPNARTGLCDVVIQSGGPGEPELPRNEPIWLTPTLYPEGLRIVVAALDRCEPMALSLRVTESFPSAGEPVDPGDPQ